MATGQGLSGHAKQKREGSIAMITCKFNIGATKVKICKAGVYLTNNGKESCVNHASFFEVSDANLPAGIEMTDDIIVPCRKKSDGEVRVSIRDAIVIQSAIEALMDAEVKIENITDNNR